MDTDLLLKTFIRAAKDAQPKEPDLDQFVKSIPHILRRSGEEIIVNQEGDPSQYSPDQLAQIGYIRMRSEVEEAYWNALYPTRCG